MNMEAEKIPDYKLDKGFLKEIVFVKLKNPSAEDFKIRLPVSVQVVRATKSSVFDGWSSCFLADGEFRMAGCEFMTKQAGPELFSIIKIKKISMLPVDLKSNIRLGEIEFETEVKGEEIGFLLYSNQREINIKELMKRKAEIGITSLEKSFQVPKPVKMVKHMWENRSEKFSDVKFTFDDESVVYANRNFLMAASEVFEAHFNNEGFVDNKSVHIVDSSPYSFNKLLEFIYMGTVQFTSWKLAFDLLYLGKKYLMTDLEDLSRDVIIDFSNYDSENLLLVREQNQETNDARIEYHIEEKSKDDIYEVINSISFLNCKFSTIEWLLSLDGLSMDEWSRLCSIYKWALHKGVTAFCQRVGEDTEECLHALLENVRYEDIDWFNLQRFMKLSKLPEIVDVSELKQNIFDSRIQDGSYLGNETNYPVYRNDDNRVYVEIEIGDTEVRRMRNIHVHSGYVSRNGPVLGFKVQVKQSQETLDKGEHSLDIVLSFQYLHSIADDNKDIRLCFEIAAIRAKSRFSLGETHAAEYSSHSFSHGGKQEFKLHFEDCRGFLSSKIEDFSVNCGGAVKSNIIALDVDIF